MARRQVVAFEGLIVAVRGQRVILSADRADIYGVETRVLNQAVKRHLDRLPADFSFRLTRDEAIENGSEATRNYRRGSSSWNAASACTIAS